MTDLWDMNVNSCLGVGCKNPYLSHQATGLTNLLMTLYKENQSYLAALQQEIKVN